MVISSLTSGGAERVMSLMANYWAERGRDVTILTLDDGSTAPFYLLHENISWTPLNLLKPSSNPIAGLMNNWRRIRKVRDELRSLAPDVIVSFMDQVNVVTIWAARGLNAPVIVSERIDPRSASISNFWKMIRDFSYRFCHALVVQTQNAKAYFDRMIPCGIYVIPNPLTPRFLTEGASSPRVREMKIAAVGRLETQKGFDFLLEAFASVAEKHPDWNLVIVGEGSLRTELEARRDRLLLRGRAEFAGRDADPLDLYMTSSIFALSSRYEGFPNALCEAMACGCAAVSFDAPSGPGDIIEHGVNGLLITSGDVKALAEAMERLMSDAPLRERLGAEARRSMRRLHPDIIMQRWDELLACAAPAE